MKRLMAAGLEEGEIMGELNGRGPMRISLPKVESGFVHMVGPKRLRVNSMSRNQ